MKDGDNCCYFCLQTFPVAGQVHRASLLMAPPTAHEQTHASTTEDVWHRDSYQDQSQNQVMETNLRKPVILAEPVSENSRPDEKVDNFARLQNLHNKAECAATPTDGVTMMICHIPCRVGFNDICAAIESKGFGDSCDFLHVPQRYRHSQSLTNLGYAFVNFTRIDVAEKFAEAFTGFQFPGKQSRKRCEVKHAHHQGYNASIARKYQHQALKHGK
jgi:hypothetical protein